MSANLGVPLDAQDFDEYSQDILDAMDEFHQGLLTFECLAAQVGPNAAAEIRNRCADGDPYIADLFDDPSEM